MNQESWPPSSSPTPSWSELSLYWSEGSVSSRSHFLELSSLSYFHSSWLFCPHTHKHINSVLPPPAHKNIYLWLSTRFATRRSSVSTLSSSLPSPTHFNNKAGISTSVKLSRSPMMNLKLSTVVSFKYWDLEIHDCHRGDDERLSHLGLITRADQNRLAAFERHIRKQREGHCMCQQCEEILRWGKIWVVCYKKEIQSMKIRSHCQRTANW